MNAPGPAAPTGERPAFRDGAAVPARDRVLFLPAIEPAERHPGAAAIAVVLDQQPRADALHAYAAALLVHVLERDAAVVDEGDGVVLRRHLGLDHAVVGRSPGRYQHHTFNMQF